MKSSFFVRKSRKRYGCEMPALRAISSVERPRGRAREDLAGRLEDVLAALLAVFRSVATVITRCKLSLTHNRCQGLRDAIELGVGQPRVQRQRERPLEAGVRAGKLPWSR
jgi:hypothetical protein